VKRSEKENIPAMLCLVGEFVIRSFKRRIIMKQSRVNWLLYICIITISLMAAPHAWGGGLYLSQLNSPLSLGTAGVNNVVNNKTADAAYTNPAGMTGIDRDTLMPGFQIIYPVVEFESDVAEAGGEDGGNAASIGAVPGFNAVKVLSDKFRLGLAISAPLGGGVDYGDKFVGRYSATRAILSGLGVTPSIGFKINDQVSVGIGVTAIYTIMDMDVAINRPGSLPDGKVSIDKIDDWSGQGIASLTLQVTDKAMLGFVYRTKSEVELEGKLDLKEVPLINRISGGADTVQVDFDLAPVYAVGLAYDLTDSMRWILDFDYEEWSEFSDNFVSVQGNDLTVIERKWDDTWHVGTAMIKSYDGKEFVTAGIGYDSSPVDDEDRTADLPVDEQVKFGIAYGKLRGEGKVDYSIGLSYVWLGKGEIDQVAQGVRYAGEFDNNYFVSIGGNVRFYF
jgi:long-chain fatty acid transport protein